MINLRVNIYLLLVITIISLLIAVLCLMTESSLDVIFLGIAAISGAVTINLFRKLRDEKKLRLY